MKISTFQKFMFSFIFTLISISIFSQDTIVTIQKDTILCKITKVLESEIFFKMKVQNKDKKMKLSKSLVSEYKIHQNIKDEDFIPSFFKYRLAFNGGYSYRTSPYEKNISSEDKAYMSKLRKGVHLGTEMMYYPFSDFGFGMKYCFISVRYPSNIFDRSSIQSDLVKDINIHFFGPKADYRLTSKNQKHFVHLHGGIGYLSYVEHFSQDGFFKFSAGTLGLSYGVGYDFLIKNHVAIGLDITYILGVLSSIKVSNGYDSAIIDLKEHPAGLNRIDFSIGIRFIR